MNLLEATADGGRVQLGGYQVPAGNALSKSSNGSLPTQVTVGVRPEAWQVVDHGKGVPVQVRLVEELGSDSFAHGEADLGDRVARIAVRLPNRGAIPADGPLHVAIEPGRAHLFDTATGERLTA